MRFHYVVIADGRVYGVWDSMVKALAWAEAEFPSAWAKKLVQVLPFEQVR